MKFFAVKFAIWFISTHQTKFGIEVSCRMTKLRLDDNKTVIPGSLYVLEALTSSKILCGLHCGRNIECSSVSHLWGLCTLFADRRNFPSEVDQRRSRPQRVYSMIDSCPEWGEWVQFLHSLQRHSHCRVQIKTENLF